MTHSSEEEPRRWDPGDSTSTLLLSCLVVDKHSTHMEEVEWEILGKGLHTVNAAVGDSVPETGAHGF